MKPYRATASRIIRTSADKVYGILADYRNGHPKILPKPYFLPMVIQQGGIGEGTVIRFQMRLIGKIHNFRAKITEPEPGHQLDETYLEPKDVVTRFFVEACANGGQCQVRITTEGKTRSDGLAGWLESIAAGAYLRRVFRKELELLAVLAESNSVNTKKK